MHFWHPLTVRPLATNFSVSLYDDLRIRLPQLNEDPPPVAFLESVRAEYEKELRGTGALSGALGGADRVVQFHRLNLAFAASASRFVVTCSEWAATTLSRRTETQMAKWLAWPPTLAEVARSWRGLRARRPVGLESRERFVLHVGGVTAHHRPDLVWPSLRRARFRDHALVLLGEDWGKGGESVALPAFRRDPSVKRSATVSDVELRWLYEHCSALLVATVSEGFCLPVLEAAACGRPIVHTRAPGIAEAVSQVRDARPLCDDLDELVRGSVELEDW